MEYVGRGLCMATILTYLWISDPAVAVPAVTLSPGTTAYVNNGSSLTLTCGVDEDLGTYFVYFTKNGIDRIFIYNVSNCASANLLHNETNAFNVSCNGLRSFTMLQKTVSIGDHGAKWRCFLTPSGGTGPCTQSPNPCTSLNVTIIVRVPVTTAQLANGLGQTISSSVIIVRGQSTDIRCSTAPRGSRPRATFQWYIRQGNRSPILIVDQSISPTPNPITVPGQPESDLLISYSTWTLTGNASYQDVYIYCQAQDETNTGNYTKSDDVQLNIVYPPAVLLSSYQSTYNVTEGMQNFVFNCNIIEANPLPQANSYSWFHKTSTIQGQTSSSYTLPSVQRSDAGEYSCTARNDYGTGTSNSLVLIVQLVTSDN